MTPDEAIDRSLLDRPAAPPVPVPVRPGGELRNITITKADGRVYDLGKPGTVRFRLNLARYKRSSRG